MILDDKLFVKDKSDIIIADFTMYSLASGLFHLKVSKLHHIILNPGR